MSDLINLNNILTPSFAFFRHDKRQAGKEDEGVLFTPTSPELLSRTLLNNRVTEEVRLREHDPTTIICQ